MPPKGKVLKVLRTDDFKVTGDGSSPAWRKAAWEPLDKRPGDKMAYRSRFKVLYSADRAVRAVQRRRPQTDGHDRKGFRRSLERGRIRVLSVAGRKADGLFRVRDFAAQPRVADPDTER